MYHCQKLWSVVLTAFCLLTFVPHGIEAGYDDSCCDACDICGFEVCGEFIWWKPMIDEATYCATFKGSNFSLKNVCPSWEPGVRVTLSKQDYCSCWNFSASYTYLECNTTDSWSFEDHILPTFTYPGYTNSEFYDRAEGTWISRYHEYDVLLSFDNTCSECYDLTHFFGIAGIYLDQDFETSLTITDSDEILNSEYESGAWALGLRFGSRFKRNICNCLNFFASGHGSILAGKSNSKTFFDTEDDNIDIDNKFGGDNVCRLIPGYHISAGFSFDRTICDSCAVSISVGYEFLAWFNLPERRTFVHNGDIADVNAAIISSGNNKTYGYHGLFAGVSFRF